MFRLGAAMISTRNIPDTRSKMAHEIEQQRALTSADANAASFVEMNISQLKRCLEDRLSYCQGRADWEEMIEDCELILRHFKKQPVPEHNSLLSQAHSVASSRGEIQQIQP
jgi:hypothetical protein